MLANREAFIQRHNEEMEKRRRAPVNVFSRPQIDSNFAMPGHLISIIDFTNDEGPNNKEISDPCILATQRILTVRFDDAEPREGSIFHCMNEGHAEAIWEFVDRIAEHEHINVHCHAGMSRSVGVAVVLSEVLQRSLEVHSGPWGTQFANSWCMALMRRRLWK